MEINILQFLHAIYKDMDGNHSSDWKQTVLIFCDWLEEKEDERHQNLHKGMKRYSNRQNIKSLLLGLFRSCYDKKDYWRIMWCNAIDWAGHIPIWQTKLLPLK